MAKVKVNITIDEELLARIERMADDFYTSRSGLITIGMSEFVLKADVSRVLLDINLALRKLADSGVVDETLQKKLADFEVFAKMITGR